MLSRVEHENSFITTSEPVLVKTYLLKGYCTVSHHENNLYCFNLKNVETARKNSKGLKSNNEFKF